MASPNLEPLGRIAPVAGTLVVLLADGGQAAQWDAMDHDLDDEVQATLPGVVRGWTPDTDDFRTLHIAGVPVLVFALPGFNRIAGLLRRAPDLLLVDPDGPFFREGGSENQRARGAELERGFLDALASPLPEVRAALGRIEVPSGKLLVVDAWQCADLRSRFTVDCDPGDYLVERFTMPCAWDPGVRMGVHGALMGRV